MGFVTLEVVIAATGVVMGVMSTVVDVAVMAVVDVAVDAVVMDADVGVVSATSDSSVVLQANGVSAEPHNSTAMTDRRLENGRVVDGRSLAVDGIDPSCRNGIRQ
ncbi:MAG: hypothetical protein AB7V43_13430 [Acidimicrobiia bacterium]